MSNIQHAVSKFNNMGGVTCYMNSILHILQQTPLFTDYIVSGLFTDYLNFEKKENNIEVTKLINYQLYQIFKASLNNDDQKITPTSFRSTISKKNNMWGEHRYQDSQEFFNFLISSLEEEMGKKVKFIPGKNYEKLSNNNKFNNDYYIKNIIAQKKWEQFLKNEWSPLKHIFTGLLCHQRQCSLCKSKSYNYQTFITIQIQIPNTDDPSKEFSLEECLDDFTNNIILDEKEKMKCDFCKRKNRASEEAKIYRPPEILVIHIKRFKMNNYGNIYKKIKNKVKYPVINLDISKYINEWSPFKKNNKYDLFGVNIHYGFGNTIDSGHYISIIKSRLNGKWYGYDDSNPVTYINNINQLVNNDACLLFYKLNKTN